MRDFKFRAWHRTRKYMTWTYPIDTFYEKVDGLAEDNEWEIMQYTGLDDENCKEIYEGDILQYDTEDGIVTAQVVFKVDDDEDAHISGFYTEFIRIEDYPEDQADAPIYFKVIGNIYENPELLEEKNCEQQ
jgi:uncharacterized phage protein (TIGR01671 family)